MDKMEKLNYIKPMIVEKGKLEGGNLPPYIPPTCKCGCGVYVTWNKRTHKWNSYLRCHYNIEKHSVIMKDRWKRGVYDNRSENTDEERRRLHLSESGKKAWADGKFDNRDTSFYSDKDYQNRRAKSISKYMQNGGAKLHEVSIDEDRLVSLYNELKSSKKVAKELGISSGCVLDRLHKLDIDVKNHNDRDDVPIQDVIIEYPKTSVSFLARKYNCDFSVIKRILIENGVKLLSPQKATKNCTPRGKYHPNYNEYCKGYCRGRNWEEQRQLALKRDEFKCVECDSTKNLHVHHIISYWKFDGDYVLANDIDNLITLCASCHFTKHEPWLLNNLNKRSL